MSKARDLLKAKEKVVKNTPKPNSSIYKNLRDNLPEQVAQSFVSGVIEGFCKEISNRIGIELGIKIARNIGNRIFGPKDDMNFAINDAAEEE
jgi:hypothetical protein